MQRLQRGADPGAGGAPQPTGLNPAQGMAIQGCKQNDSLSTNIEGQKCAKSGSICISSKYFISI